MNLLPLLTNRNHRPCFTRPADSSDLELEIDNSTLSKWRACPRSAEFYKVLGRDNASRDALNYGSAIHKACEHYYLTGDSTQIPDLLFAHFSENPQPEGSWRTVDHAIRAMQEYVALREQMPPWIPIAHNGKPAVEVPFRLPLFSKSVYALLPFPEKLLLGEGDNNNTYVENINVYYTGKIDLAIESHVNPGAYDILDHKTSSMGGPTFWSAFKLSPQFIGYTWASDKLFGKRCDRAIVDAIFGRAYSVKGKGVPHEFQTQSFQYSDDQVECWLRDTKYFVNQFLEQLQQDHFPANTDSCFGKYGECSYFNVCSLPAHTHSTMLASGLYTDTSWSPLN